MTTEPMRIDADLAKKISALEGKGLPNMSPSILLTWIEGAILDEAFNDKRGLNWMVTTGLDPEGKFMPHLVKALQDAHYGVKVLKPSSDGYELSIRW